MGYIAWTLFVVVILYTRTVRSQINGTDYENSIVVTSLRQNILSLQNVHINMIPGTLYEIKSGSYVMGLKNYNTRILSVDVDYARSRLYIFDFNTAAIYAIDDLTWRENFTNITIRVIHDGLSRYSNRLCVDWVSNNIYWTDSLFGWIVVQSGSKDDTYKILVHDLEKPLALAVDPVYKYMFWSDIGSTVKIERASLAGTDKQTLISTGLAYPTSIDIDQTAHKLVWVDSVRDSLETANFDGSGRKVIRRLSHTEFYDVAVFKDLVAVTELANGSLFVFNKNTGVVQNSYTKTNGDPFLAVALYSAHIQQAQTDDCGRYGCSDICINDKNGPVCLCKEGYKLNQDGTSCSEELGKFHRALVWSNSSSICMMDIRSLTSNGHTDIKECFYKGGTSITLFDIDMSERNVVFADGTDIYSVNIQQNPVKQRLVSATQQITGIAIDWRDNNVYWCMGSTTGEINIVSQETKMKYTLINTNLAYPKNINILPFHNVMFWISGPSGASKLERSELDGSNRKIIVSGGPSGNIKELTADLSTNVLYFLDGGYVKSCDIDGNKLTTLTPVTTLYSPQKLLTYKNYLVVADRRFPDNVINVYEKKSEPDLKFQLAGINADTMTDMHVLDALLHPDQKGPCAILNGDCEQICIPIGRNRICQCEYGFQLDSNKETCSSIALVDNFLLVTDWTHNQIYQVSLVNDDVRAVDTDTYGSPIGIAFNHVTRQVIWNTNTLVHSIRMNDSRYNVILNTELLSCHADRFAIDSSSGNIYYTAVRTSLSGFGGVGVISPNGLHKRLISTGVILRDIVLDPEDGLLFWTDHGNKPGLVRRANMDGSNSLTIIDSGLVWPNGLAIDTKANALYVTDGLTNVIYKCSYKGVCSKYYTDNDAHLMDITLLGDYLYYTAWNRPYVSKLHKTNPGSIFKVGYKPELGRLDSLSLYSSTVQSSTSTHCSTNNGRGPCSTFCLPTPNGYECSCEDNVNLRSDGKTCENVQLTTTPATTTTTTKAATTTTPAKTTIKATSPFETSTTQRTSPSEPRTTPSKPSTTSPTSVTTMEPSDAGKQGSTDKATGVPVTAIGGAAAGFAVLIIVIVILVIFLVRRSNNKNNTTGGQSTSKPDNQYETGFDISSLTNTNTQSQRPDSTYDLITFDLPEDETKTNKENNDNNLNDYMSLVRRPKDYEKLNVKKGTRPSEDFRPSAVPNDYHRMAGTTNTGKKELDDYLEPIHTIQSPSFDADFNNPVYQDDSTSGYNRNPFAGSVNPVSGFSYS